MNDEQRRILDEYNRYLRRERIESRIAWIVIAVVNALWLIGGIEP